MPRGATAAKEKKWEEAAIGVGDVPFHPYTVEEDTTCQGRKKV